MECDITDLSFAYGVKKAVVIISENNETIVWSEVAKCNACLFCRPSSDNGSS